MPYVTGTQILVNVGKGAGTAQEQADAQKCADAIEAAIALRLDGETPSAGGVDALEVSALIDGSALFNMLATPSGIASITMEGEVVRLGSDSLRASNPVIWRVHSTAGIGIG
jgi:hypothetical protein